MDAYDARVPLNGDASAPVGVCRVILSRSLRSQWLAPFQYLRLTFKFLTFDK